MEAATNPAQLRMAGQFHGRLDGRRIGGILRHGVPGASVDYINLSASDNQENGFTYGGANALIYVYLLTPFGLPRWARYTDGPSGRVPRAPFGIPVVSRVVAPTHLTGKPSAAIALPAATGLGGSTSSGICIGTTISSGAGLYNVMCDGRVCWNAQALGVAAAGGASFTAANFTLIEGTTHPAHAKAIYVRFGLVVDIPIDTTAVFSPSVGVGGPGGLTGGATIYLGPLTFANTSGVAALTDVPFLTEVVRIPIWPQYPTTPGGTKVLAFAAGLGGNYYVGAIPVFKSASMSVVGWELGP